MLTLFSNEKYDLNSAYVMLNAFGTLTSKGFCNIRSEAIKEIKCLQGFNCLVLSHI